MGYEFVKPCPFCGETHLLEYSSGCTECHSCGALTIESRDYGTVQTHSNGRWPHPDMTPRRSWRDRAQPTHAEGSLEWALAQPVGAMVRAYDGHVWRVVEWHGKPWLFCPDMRIYLSICGSAHLAEWSLAKPKTYSREYAVRQAREAIRAAKEKLAAIEAEMGPGDDE